MQRSFVLSMFVSLVCRVKDITTAFGEVEGN